MYTLYCHKYHYLHSVQADTMSNGLQEVRQRKLPSRQSTAHLLLRRLVPDRVLPSSPLTRMSIRDSVSVSVSALSFWRHEMATQWDG